MGRYSIGIDIGSVSAKVAVLDESGKVVKTGYRRFHGRPFQTLKALLDNNFLEYLSDSICLGFTGIGGRVGAEILGGLSFGEITCIASANYVLLPNVQSIIEMGGEDSKYIQVDAEKKVVVDFSMNNLCAAGTGSFLDQQAGRLKISIDKEFGQMALKSKNPPRIAGRCSVFAKSDMIHLQQIATPDFDIVAGLCYAVARNFKSSIARGKKFIPPVAFEGGVAANPGVIRAFKDILDINENDLIIPGYFNVIGAIGAAIQAQSNSDKKPIDIDTKKITGYLNYRNLPDNGLNRLSFDYPDSKYYSVTKSKSNKEINNLEVYLGLDVGSLSTNLVLIDKDKNVIARRYLMTEGRPIEAVRRGLSEIGDEVGDRVEVVSVATTGSGRYLTGDFVGADLIKNEITAQATAAINIDPGVDTIFEIGGQDSKYISLHNKTVIDFEMNKACAAGTGSFLQEQAEKLKINIEQEFGDRALSAECPVGCGERCTVFMESDLVSHQRRGAKTDDLVAGLAYSIVSNYLTKVVGDRKIGNNIFFQGGVAWNRGVVAAFEKMMGKKITVPPHHDITGAIGAALLVMEGTTGEKTNFRGFDLSKRKYSISTFTCDECDNHCEIRKVELENEEPLYYGSRCEKYDVKKKSKTIETPDYFKLRQQYLLKRYIDVDPKKLSRGRVGFPRILHFFEHYPFWKAMFESLGFKVVNSDLSNQEIVKSALEKSSAETCFPIKMAYGHIENLIKKNVDYIFLPGLTSFIEGDSPEKGSSICMYVQSISSSISARFNFADLGIKFIGTPIHLQQNNTLMYKQLRNISKVLHVSDHDIRAAVDKGFVAYSLFRNNLLETGREFLDNLKEDEKCLVVVSRPYNGFDRRLSLDIPQKIRKMGIKAIHIDYLALDIQSDDLSSMYWFYGRKILSAANVIRRHPNLYAVYLSSFGCGPDSFITHFFRRNMSGKPYLQLELDEHSADAGMITRLEAFLDSLRFYKYEQPITDYSPAKQRFKADGKILYIPKMCDHAYAVRASFEKCGMKAIVMDDPNEQSLIYGKKFTSGKECFPCVVTTGDMIRQINSKDFDPNRAVFFMPGADGPCRFGQYSQLHRVILDELGYKNIPIYSPSSQTSYGDFDLEKTGFRRLAWKGSVFVDCLTKALLKTRPYEIEKGQTEEVYKEYLKKVEHVIVNGKSIQKLAEEAGGTFNCIPIKQTRKPIIGLVGEIYLRNNRYSNNFLIEKLEALGCEVRLAVFTEWVNYTTLTYRLDSINYRRIKGVVGSIIQAYIQHRDEHKITKRFVRYLQIDEELPIEKIIQRAQPYLPVEVRGEAALSIGKAIDFVGRGASGIVNCMPFNCMPGTVVSSLSSKIAEDLGGVPWLNISYEGLQDTGEETKLEAFVDQVKSNSYLQKKVKII